MESNNINNKPITAAEVELNGMIGAEALDGGEEIRKPTTKRADHIEKAVKKEEAPTKGTVVSDPLKTKDAEPKGQDGYFPRIFLASGGPMYYMMRAANQAALGMKDVMDKFLEIKSFTLKNGWEEAKKQAKAAKKGMLEQAAGTMIAGAMGVAAGGLSVGLSVGAIGKQAWDGHQANKIDAQAQKVKLDAGVADATVARGTQGKSLLGRGIDRVLGRTPAAPEGLNVTGTRGNTSTEIFEGASPNKYKLSPAEYTNRKDMLREVKTLKTRAQDKRTHSASLVQGIMGAGNGISGGVSNGGQIMKSGHETKQADFQEEQIIRQAMAEQINRAHSTADGSENNISQEIARLLQASSSAMSEFARQAV